MNENFWKDKYKETWEFSSAREQYLKNYIEKNTKKKCIINGFGAGSAEYFSGNAQKYGHQIGETDLQILGTNIYIEVTGPLSKKVLSSAPLWFRPDKIKNAIANPNHDVFFVHNCAYDDTWRVIHVDSVFKARFANNKFCLVRPFIRGSRETYVQIDVSDSCIQNLFFLCNYIKQKA